MEKRKYPIGAEIVEGGVHFRVWAPDHQKVDVVLEEFEKEPLFYPMEKEKDGYFSLLVNTAKSRSLYRYRLSNSVKFYVDPASRYQPSGPNGPSCVVDTNFGWTDQKWPGAGAQGHVVYEMHIATFTQEGTFKAAMQELSELKNLGITLIEIMPINDFPGHYRRGFL
jgi:maltooligosyltrehalose trehalohydrolase